MSGIWFNGLPVPSDADGSQKYWFNGLPIPTLPIGVNLVGVGATGSAGSFGAAPTNVNLFGVAATGRAGTCTAEIDKAITGNAATGSSGAILGEIDSALAGVAATGNAGIVTQPANFVTGASVTGSAGSIIPADSDVINGVVATAGVGTITSDISTGIIGVVGTGSSVATTESISATANVPSVSATGDAGTLRPIGIAGTVSFGFAGTIHSAVEHAFVGVQASAQTATIPESVSGVGGTAEGIGEVGDFTIDIFTGVVINGVVGHAGVATPEGADVTLGVSASTEIGRIRANPGANLYSVGLVGSAGSFAFSQLKNITGAAASGSVGQIVGTIPQPVVGVQASAQIGSIAKVQSKTLTGVHATGIATQFVNAFLSGNAASGAVGSLAKIETKLIAGVQGNSGLGALLPDLVTPVRYYLTAQSNFGALVPNVIPTPTVISTGWKVGRNAVGEFGILKFNNEQNSFSTSTQLSAAPTATNGNSWRSLSPINGVIDAGQWTVSMAFRAVSRFDGQAGRIHVRIYKATGSNGTGATQITTSELIGNTVVMSTSVDAISALTFNTTAPINFSNEYLFVEVEWEITSAGSNPNDDVDFSLGANSYVELPITAVNANVNGVGASGSAGALAVAEEKTIPAVAATGTAGSFIAAKDTQFAIPGVFATCDHGVFDFIVAANIRGVQAFGISNHPFSQVALIGSISLVSANGVGFAGDIGVPMEQPLAGNGAIGQAGEISAAIEKDVSLNGVQANTGVGNIVGENAESADLESVIAVGDVGTINGGIELVFDGVSGFAVVGSLTPDQQRLLRGVFGTGFAGPVRRQPDIAAALPSVEATGSAGTCTDYRIDSVLTGVEAQGDTGDLPFELTSLLDTDPMFGQIGDINAEVDQFWTGVEAQGFVGRLHPNSALMDGAGATGVAGVIVAKGRSRGGNQRLLPRIVHTADGGQVLWYDLTAPKS